MHRSPGLNGSLGLLGRLGLLGLLALTGSAAARQGGADAPVRFQWAFAARTGPETARTLSKITDDVTLKSGDELQMLIGPVTSCYVYLLHEDPKGVITSLFPETPDAFPPGYRAGAVFYVPSRYEWLQLDKTVGIERLYLVGSPSRLARLEAAVKKGSRTEMISELSALRKQHAKADWVERPVTIGGQVRGKQEATVADIAPMATEIAAGAFFSRVFVIDHR